MYLLERVICSVSLTAINSHSVFKSTSSCVYTFVHCFRRNQNSRDIMRSLANSVGTKNFADFDVTNQFNHVFCLGDLNYRVDGEINVR